MLRHVRDQPVVEGHAGPKRTILLGPNYPPETNAAAKRMAATAEHLACRGWEVTVVTLLPHYPQNAVYEGYEDGFERQYEGGVEVVRVRPWIVRRDHLVLRLLSELVFCFQALWHVVTSPRADVVMASIPYMFLGPFGWVGARIRRSRFIWEIRDLTWEYARATGKRSYGLDRAIERVMRLVAQRSDAIITATSGQLPYFSQRPAIAEVVPNGLTDDILRELTHLPAAAEGVDGTLTVTYAGLLGYPQALRTVVDAAALVPSLEVVFVGDGPERDALEERARTRLLHNVRFAGYVPFDTLLEHYARSDIFVAHLRDRPEFHVAQPSKIWEYMATGRAVVFAGRGEAAAILRDHDIGLVVPPEDPEALAAALRDLAREPDRRRALGARGREFVLAHRRRSVLLTRLSDVFDALTR